MLMLRGRCYLAALTLCVLFNTTSVADEASERLAKVDVGLNTHLTRHDLTTPDPWRVFVQYFVPRVIDQAAADELETRYRVAIKDAAKHSRVASQARTEKQLPNIMTTEQLAAWRQLKATFDTFERGQQVDVAKLASVIQQNAGNAVSLERVMFGLTDILTQCVVSIEERETVTQLRRESKAAFYTQREQIRRKAFERLDRRDPTWQIRYLENELPAESEALREATDHQAVLQILAAVSPATGAKLMPIVNVCSPLLKRMQDRTAAFNKDLLQIFPDATPLRPFPLFRAYSLSYSIIPSYADNRSKLTAIIAAESAAWRMQLQTSGIAMLATEMSNDDAAALETIFTEIREYQTRRSEIWEPFAKKMSLGYSPTTTFDFELMYISSAVGLDSKTSSKMRKLQRAENAVHRKIMTATTSSRGWSATYFQSSDTQPMAIGYREDIARVQEAATILREQEAIKAALELTPAEKKVEVQQLFDLYIDSANQQRLLNRQRIATIEKAVGAAVIRGCILPNEFQRDTAVQLVKPRPDGS